MRYFNATVLVCSLSFTAHDIAQAQPLAFPGAEGVAQFVTGGRGTLVNPGDVYRVINLNDSGDGSLRYGIQNAPAAGRTIVFDVAGTIHLTSSLDTNGKSNITIAGQTAPAGGITIADHRVRINNSSNVIFQHLRVRPGNTFGTQQPDAIWVESSNNVMIDHITASWGVDETISTTHNSNNVTVQWSTMTQGLYDSDHPSGDGHSYGSLINGGAYSYHHNLYAHNKSRNPRVQASGNYLRLDFVNNVNFNHQDRMGYSDSNDPYDLNWVGNYLIKGPKSSANNFMMRPDDIDSHIYTEGNRADIVRDGFVNGAEVDEAAVFDPGDAYTLFPSRLSAAQLPLVNTHSANEAYIHVLSRAGAVNYRDSVDRKTIRSVMNQLDWSINTEQDVTSGNPPEVGWPTLPTGIAPADANGDGVPDSWASTNYGDTSTPLNSAFAPDGYTYLEKYIHSLTPYAYVPTGTVSHTISTAFGQGADAQINENGGTSATSSGVGDGTQLNALWSGTSGNNNQVIALKFDLSEVEPGSVNSASLELTASESIVGTHTFRVFGLEHDADGWDWDESTIDFDTLAGVNFDGNSRTLGINPNYTANGLLASPSNPALDVPDLLRLGEFSANNLTAGETVSLNNLNLAVFLNLAAFFEGESQEGLVTLILEQINNSGTDDASFYSKEGNPLLAPRLVVDALVDIVTPGGLAGDYNNDNVIDAADYTVWRDAMTAGSTSLLNDPTPGTVDESDFLYWRNHFGESLGSGSGQGAAAVPEPASLVLMITSATILLVTFRPRKHACLRSSV